MPRSLHPDLNSLWMCWQEMSKSSDQDLMMLLPYVQSSQTNARSWPPQQQAQLPGAASFPAF